MGAISESVSQFFQRNKNALIALALYAAIATILFSPLLASLGSSTLSPNIARPDVIRESRDRYHFIWNFWSVGNSLATGQNVFYTKMMFAPSGVPLVLQTVDFVDAAIFGPISLIAGNIAAFNLVIFLSFILSGFTAFLLGRHLTGSWIAGFGAGLVFSYFPQHVNQALFGHPNLSSLEWMPAYLLALIVTFEQRKLRYPIAAGIFLALITFTELEQLIMAVIATLIFLGYILIKNRLGDLRGFLWKTSTIIVVWLGLASFYLVQAYEAVATQSRAPPPVNQIYFNAAKPIFYITPQPASFMYGSFFSPNYSPYSPFLLFPHPGGTAQWIIFVGFVTLALSVIGVLLYKGPRKYYFLAVAVIALILSLGPSAEPSQISLQTPYTFLFQHLSILQYFRAGARFSILLMLALTGLVAFGIDALLKLATLYQGTSTKFVRRNLPKIVGLVILALILLEFAPVITTQGVASDPVYKMIASDHSQFNVLELPGSITVTDIALYEQTIFNKPLINGKVSQVGQVYPSFMYSQLFLRILAEPTLKTVKESFDHHVNQEYNETQLAALVMSIYHIKYVIVNYNQIFTHNQYNIITRTLYEALGAPVYQDSNVLAFELPQWLSVNSEIELASRGPIVLFGPGWAPETNYARIANNSAELMVFAARPASYSFVLNSTVPLCVNNPEIQTLQSPCGTYDPLTHFATNQVWLNAGENNLTLAIPNGFANITSIQVSS